MRKNNALIAGVALLITMLATVSPCVSAASIMVMEERFVMDSSGMVSASVALRMNGSGSQKIWLPLPSNFTQLTVRMNGAVADPALLEDGYYVEVANSTNVTLSYNTIGLTDGNDFLYDFSVPYAIDSLDIVLELPQSVLLAEPMDPVDKTKGSIYPKPDQALSDGKSIRFVWRWQDLSPGREIPIYVKCMKVGSWFQPIIWALLICIIVVTAIMGWQVFRFIDKNKSSRASVAGISKHLKEDELAVVNVIKSRDGERCEQGTLMVITGMSKASLSRLLSELEGRNIIYKEQKGKKNIIHLRS